MQYSQEQLQSILNSTLGTAPNQDDNGCPWATQHCCPSCGSAASCQTTQTQSVVAASALPPTATQPAQSTNPGYSTTWPFFPGFPGGCYPPAPPTTSPASNGGSGQDNLIAPNQDDNGCPWATQHCCPSCGSAASCPSNGNGTTNGNGNGNGNGTGAGNGSTGAGSQALLSQNPLFSNALSPTVFPSDIAPNMDENGCPLYNGCSVYGYCG